MTDNKDWYSPHSITFTKDQVKFLIPHLPMLRTGDYPRNPKESGYTDADVKARQFKAGARWETAAGIAAELDIRIQRAGCKGDRIHDGLLMEMLYSAATDDEVFIINHMAESHGISAKEIYQRIRNALYFVSGSGRKATKYSDYVKDGHKYLKIQ